VQRESIGTLKALANLRLNLANPGLSLANAFSVGIQSLLNPRVVASSNLGGAARDIGTLKALANPRLNLANAFSVGIQSLLNPRVVASSNPGLKLANAFGVQLANAFGLQLANALGVQLGDTTAFPVLSTPVFSKP
jgi:hypothetical protein